MIYEKQNFIMSDKNTIVWHSWKPEGEIKAVVLLSHGMVEHARRYERLANFLCDRNIALYAEDHRGHGETGLLSENEGTGRLCYLADKKGFFRVVDDIHEEALKLKSIYPNLKLFLLGHSFGSFISQCFIEKYGECIDGVILCGSAGPRLFLTRTAKFIAGVIRLFCGKKRVSKFIDNLAFGSYCKKIPSPKTSYDWLTRDENEVQKYIDDPLCGMICTTQFYYDMFEGLCYIHKKSMMKKISAKLPVYIIAGKEDPVGSYGKTVSNLYEIYKKNGISDVTLKLYDEDRHELFNEKDRITVEFDLYNWIEKRL